MDNSHIEYNSVELIIWLVNFRVVVVKEHEQGHLMKNQFLAQAHIQVVCFDVAEHR